MAIDLDAEIEAARQKLAELDRLRELAAARLAELDRLRGSRIAQVRRVMLDSRFQAPDLSRFVPRPRGRVRRPLGEPRPAVDLATRRGARTSGSAASAASPRCAAANAATQRSSRSTTVSCWPTFRDARSSGSIRCFPMTVAGCSRSILIAARGAPTRKRSRRTARSLGLNPQSSDPDPATAPISGSSSPTRSQPPKHDGSASPSSQPPWLRVRRSASTPTTACSQARTSSRAADSETSLPYPYNAAARNAGNTEFLDDRLEPHRDQWSYLASIPKITPHRLAELIADGDEDGALAVRPADGASDPPWRPPRTLRERLSETRLPESIEPRWRIASTSIVRSFLRHSLTRSGDSRRSPTRCSPSSSGCGCQSPARLV